MASRYAIQVSIGMHNPPKALLLNTYRLTASNVLILVVEHYLPILMRVPGRNLGYLATKTLIL
jgi:hypothetical protein